MNNYNRPLARFIRAFSIMSVVNDGEYKYNYNLNTSMKCALSDVGMDYHSGIFINDILMTIDRFVEKNISLMIHVDCYYLSYYKDYYLKKHCDHVLTLRGHELDKNSYIVIDQKNLNSVSFTRNSIDSRTLEKAIRSAYGTRESFYGVDYVYLIESESYNDLHQRLPDTQLKEIVLSTIQYLNENDADISNVIEKFLNYLLIEKEVCKYENKEMELHLLEKQESQLRRLFMNFIGNLSDCANVADDIIDTLEQML